MLGIFYFKKVYQLNFADTRSKRGFLARIWRGNGGGGDRFQLEYGILNEFGVWFN